MINKIHVAKQFNRAVPSYEEHAVVQKQMASDLINGLQQEQITPRKILEIGCGTGVMTEMLVRAFPLAQITALDLADQMIAEAKCKPALRDVTFITADAEQWAGNETEYDVILSNATIQWFTQPTETLKKWKAWLSPVGKLMLTTFGEKTFQELHACFQQVEASFNLKPQTHGLLLHSLTNWQEICKEAGFQNIDSEETCIRLNYLDSRDFLQSIKDTGASYSQSKEGMGISFKVLARVMRLYNEQYRTRDGVYATYHTLRFIVHK
ncbi:malonyl-ACP O-methyltransferase BioC [Hazenella sp. IB182357]|uniref:Malonyl-[acyl-carrier protein] O-methyltransferase n=1 Tax=Polycladospora coralii TaxID=2771432 RepID=A0A926NAK5_9BACL|nr:malonyl-ACP O-methyltransferase BioC [Polycladospora coralii]MBD1372537.1 malonyl-ACP O-methyltransferase BioC [Polycladospora coralii]MBS7531340.1 malonyl-ACP O-methyltransferase BioC [Polycladospora coralii]